MITPGSEKVNEVGVLVIYFCRGGGGGSCIPQLSFKQLCLANVSYRISIEIRPLELEEFTSDFKM